MLLLLTLACVPKPAPAADDSGADTAADTDADTAADTDTDPGTDTDTAVDTGPLDADGDGWLAEDDCDDTDPAVHPGAADTCDGVDQDCDGALDEDGTTEPRWGGWPVASRASGPYLTKTQAADLDGDGRVDLLGCRDHVNWTLNPGTPWIVEGTWMSTWARTEDFDDYCVDLDVADVDGDGDLDALMTTYTARALVWSENVAGVFGAPRTLATGLQTGASLAVGDFDGDGLPDLAVAPHLLWNEGGGAFSEEPDPCSSSAYRFGAVSVATDGRATLLCGDAGRMAAADRTWSDVPVAAACAMFPSDQGPTRAGDLDGDGLADVIVAGTEVCVGDGTGALFHGAHLFDAMDTTWVTDLADADGDGAFDFVVNAESSEVGDLVLVRGGTGGPAVAGAAFIPYGIHQGGGALWEDLDGDGAADLLAWDGHDNAWYLFPSDGAGGFVTPWAGDTEYDDHHGTAADLDGDGVQEVVLLAADAALVWWADGARDYVGGDAYALPDPPASFSPYVPVRGGLDLDGDGDEEIVTLDSDLLVLDWDGAALVVTDTAFNYSYDATSTEVRGADLDGDGDDELLFDNLARARGDIYGDGDIDDPEQLRIAGLDGADLAAPWTDLVDSVGDALAAATGDLDGDGADDLVFVDATGVRVWGWDGAALVERASAEVAWASGASDLTSRRGLGLADADGDGALDLWLALPGEAAVQVLLQDGAGGFSLGARFVAPADMVDRDRLRLDRLDGERIAVWDTLDGAGGVDLRSWRLAADPAVGFEALPLATSGIDAHPTVRDMDGDGVVDLVGATRGRGFVFWGATEAVVRACE